jgi:hypothetical protein
VTSPTCTFVPYGGNGESGALGDTWRFRFEQANPADERCLYGIDGDGDGKIGCADPDCFGSCQPDCNPTTMTCDPAAPHCGDGTCQSTLETKRLCPADRGAATVQCGDFLCESPETTATCPGDCP